MQDRVPTYPGRVTLTPVPGQANKYDMVRADEPTQVGDALNKANLLPDAVATALGLTGNPQVADAFNKISTFGVSKQYFQQVGTTTFIAPYTGKYYVEVVGGGSYFTTSTSYGAGYAAKTVTLVKGQQVTVTVGKRASGGGGEVGEASSFGSMLSATGGKNIGYSGGGTPVPGSPGYGVGGDINISGLEGSYVEGSAGLNANGLSFLSVGSPGRGTAIGWGYGGSNGSSSGKSGVVIITMLDKGV